MATAPLPLSLSLSFSPSHTPFSIFFLFSSLSSPFSSSPFLPFSPFFSSLFLSFPFSLFLPLFLFPFLFSFSLFFLPFSLFSFFPSFFFPFPLFPLPDFCSPSRFLVSGGAVCPPAPPLARPLHVHVSKLKWLESWTVNMMLIKAQESSRKAFKKR